MLAHNVNLRMCMILKRCYKGYSLIVIANMYVIFANIFNSMSPYNFELLWTKPRIHSLPLFVYSTLYLTLFLYIFYFSRCLYVFWGYLKLQQNAIQYIWYWKKAWYFLVYVYHWKIWRRERVYVYVLVTIHMLHCVL